MIDKNIEALSQTLLGKGPRPILREALENNERVALSFSGAEDVVLIDLAVKIRPDIEVFTLDTGRLHAETYQFIEAVREHYQLKLQILSPDKLQVQQLVAEKGLFSFYQDGHKECCGIRKVQALRAHLPDYDAWITGQRKDQSLDTRADLAEVEIDTGFSNSSRPLIKFNPLANWSSQQVWDHILAYEVPYNQLHTQGFRSIGCEPCTRATHPGQHEREGRWWWESSLHKECGIHKNVS